MTSKHILFSNIIVQLLLFALGLFITINSSSSQGGLGGIVVVFYLIAFPLTVTLITFLIMLKSVGTVRKGFRASFYFSLFVWPILYFIAFSINGQMDDFSKKLESEYHGEIMSKRLTKLLESTIDYQSIEWNEDEYAIEVQQSSGEPYFMQLTNDGTIKIKVRHIEVKEFRDTVALIDKGLRLSWPFLDSCARIEIQAAIDTNGMGFNYNLRRRKYVILIPKPKDRLTPHKLAIEVIENDKGINMQIWILRQATSHLNYRYK